ncbi:MAG: hypothetical protein WCJ72_12340 [Chryseobacterium sp.]
MDEDEDPAARKRRKDNERKKRWLEKQDPESRERIRAAKAAASRLRIAAETPEQRKARQAVDALAHQSRIAAETPEQRSARQAVDALAHQIRITAETPEQRSARQALDAVAHHIQIAAETNQQREIRLSANLHSQQLARQRQTEAILQEAINYTDNSVAHHSCGPLDVVCQFCGSRNFAAERPADRKFTSCCRKGKVKLSKPLDDNGVELEYPDFLRALLSDSSHPNHTHFRQHIRSYNSAVSFASMGAKIVDLPGRGPYVFKVSMVDLSLLFTWQRYLKFQFFSIVCFNEVCDSF